MTQARRTAFPPTLLCDFYKLAHREQYPEKTQKVYSTWTPRASRAPGINKVVVFGIQGFVKEVLLDYFNENFFSRPKADVVAEYIRVVKFCLGVENPDATHIGELHDLGYLPIHIKALPEGTRVPLRVPMMTIENTEPKFYWLTNYLETLASCELWLPSTSATTAFTYRSLLERYAKLTGGALSFVKFQGHDFSMRGMGGVHAASLSGSGHLLSFVGTDTIPAILRLEQFYNANIETELVGTSIPATEHSVMCAHGQDEAATYEHLIFKVYPKGFLSIVSDTWDFWGVLNNVIQPLAERIKARDGKVVIRPDSGDPVKIICGDPDADFGTPESRGAVQILWDIFGGTTNAAGFKELHPSIGLIYGDAITLERCEDICRNLMNAGFASTNVVFGIGSYTYQFVTRDTFGFALKSTYVEIGGEGKAIFKDPITDQDGIKKSARGRVAVRIGSRGGYSLEDQLDRYDNPDWDELQTVFYNGHLVLDTSLAVIRGRIEEELAND